MKEILEKIKSGEITVSYDLVKFKTKNKLVDDLYRTNITLSEFIDKLPEEHEFKAEEIFDDNFLIVEKKRPFPLQLKVDSSKIILLHHHFHTIKDKFPELEQLIKDINSYTTKGCAGCDRRGLNFAVIMSMVILGGKDRDLKNFDAFLGKVFVRELSNRPKDPTLILKKVLEPVYKQIHSVEVQNKRVAVPLNDIITKAEIVYAPRKSCLNCTRKHIASAVVYLHESIQLKYKNHFFLALGEIYHAEMESARDYKQISTLIRNTRLQLEETMSRAFDYDKIFDKIEETENGVK